MKPLPLCDFHDGRLCTCYMSKAMRDAVTGAVIPRVCSHVAMQETVAGDPLITDIKCLAQACDMIGCELVQQSTYDWWGRHVGDYPVPKGMQAGELGKNAEYVIRAKPENKAKLGGSSCYDIGVVPDPNNEGAWTWIYDFYGQGDRIDRLVGSPVRGQKGIEMLCPALKQHYDMCCDAAAAKEAGDKIEFMSVADLRANFEPLQKKYPQLRKALPLPPVSADDENRWVSIVDTTQRVGVG